MGSVHPKEERTNVKIQQQMVFEMGGVGVYCVGKKDFLSVGLKKRLLQRV